MKLYTRADWLNFLLQSAIKLTILLYWVLKVLSLVSVYEISSRYAQLHQNYSPR